jgi:hypothetical protein
MVTSFAPQGRPSVVVAVESDGYQILVLRTALRLVPSRLGAVLWLSSVACGASVHVVSLSLSTLH